MEKKFGESRGAAAEPKVVEFVWRTNDSSAQVHHYLLPFGAHDGAGMVQGLRAMVSGR
jgi:hypothetical protein